MNQNIWPAKQLAIDNNRTREKLALYPHLDASHQLVTPINKLIVVTLNTNIEKTNQLEAHVSVLIYSAHQ